MSISHGVIHGDCQPHHSSTGGKVELKQGTSSAACMAWQIPSAHKCMADSMDLSRTLQETRAAWPQQYGDAGEKKAWQVNFVPSGAEVQSDMVWPRCAFNGNLLVSGGG